MIYWKKDNALAPLSTVNGTLGCRSTPAGSHCCKRSACLSSTVCCLRFNGETDTARGRFYNEHGSDRRNVLRLGTHSSSRFSRHFVPLLQYSTLISRTSNRNTFSKGACAVDPSRNQYFVLKIYRLLPRQLRRLGCGIQPCHNDQQFHHSAAHLRQSSLRINAMGYVHSFCNMPVHYWQTVDCSKKIFAFCEAKLRCTCVCKEIISNIFCS